MSSLVDQARAYLTELDRARQRLRDGTYGICEVCRARIAPARLQARPVARTCVGCASRPS